MPIGPEDAVGLDVHVHGLDAHVGVALERLLVHPVGHARVQTADLVVVGNVEDLLLAVPSAWGMREGRENERGRERERRRDEEGMGCRKG